MSSIARITNNPQLDIEFQNALSQIRKYGQMLQTPISLDTAVRIATQEEHEVPETIADDIMSGEIGDPTRYLNWAVNNIAQYYVAERHKLQMSKVDLMTEQELIKQAEDLLR